MTTAFAPIHPGHTFTTVASGRRAYSRDTAPPGYEEVLESLCWAGDKYTGRAVERYSIEMAIRSQPLPVAPTPQNPL